MAAAIPHTVRDANGYVTRVARTNSAWNLWICDVYVLSPTPLFPHALLPAFGSKWDPDFIRWSLNLGNITFTVCTLPLAWAVSMYGRRNSTLFVIAGTTVANALRYVHVHVAARYWVNECLASLLTI